MAHTHLVTGPPRSGKTTVIERVADRLRERGATVGGVVTPERRVDGDRVGFDCRDLLTGETATVASVDRDELPEKYRAICRSDFRNRYSDGAIPV